MDRMDALHRSSLRPTIALRDAPSTYVRRQCWISADPDEGVLPLVMEYVGPDRFVWATDYPHSDHDGGYMGELHALAERLPPADRAKLLGENAANVYVL
jgi:predicted TIM-barrel fold metal-dependent hydrolase